MSVNEKEEDGREIRKKDKRRERRIKEKWRERERRKRERKTSGERIQIWYKLNCTKLFKCKFNGTK